MPARLCGACLQTERGSSMPRLLTSPLQTRNRTRRVRTFCLSIIRIHFLLAWINLFGTCTVLIARDREASLAHCPQQRASCPLVIAKNC